jgi:hypothetical protein
MHKNYTRSIFVDSIVPQYIREEYPLFVSFLKSYYDFLDRKAGQLIAVTIDNPGKNYANPTVTLNVNGLADSRENKAEFSAVTVNGRLTKIVVTSYGEGYDPETEDYQIIITDGTGSGASATAVIVKDFGNINSATVQLSSSRDIDEEIKLITEFLRNEYIGTVPRNLYTSDTASVELSKFIKFIKQFYNSRGIEDSVKFIYRILYNAEVELYYPKTDMLRVSDGRWNVDKFIYVDSSLSYSDFKAAWEGHRIIENTSATTAIIQSVEEVVGQSFYKVNLSNVNGKFAGTVGNENLYDYPPSGVATVIGSLQNWTGATGFSITNTIYRKDAGEYIGDWGQLSSTKKVQDSYYYQDFSYVLQSEESIRQFKTFFETLIHPAGFRYFITLNIYGIVAQKMRASIEAGVVHPPFLIDNIAELSPYSESLGPINRDIDTNKDVTVPILPIVDFSGTSAVTGATSALDISESAGFVPDRREFINWSVIIQDGTNTFYRRVVDYNSSTSELILDSSYTAAASPVDYRVIQNYRIGSIDVSAKTITLSTHDPLFNIAYSPQSVSVLSASTTASTGATGIVVNTSDDYNIIVGDVIQVDSEKMLVNWIKGATGVWNLSVTRAHNSTSVASHTIGATAYNTTDHRYRNWRIYITSGPGEGQFSRIVSYEATGVIGYSSSYTLHASGSTAPTTNSTYYLLPDFAGATSSNNYGYYTTGSTGISSIKVSNGGSGYVTGGGYGVRVDISAPVGSTGFGTGIPRVAGATAVVSGGVITAVNITDPGSYYLFAPIVNIVQLGATGPSLEAKAWANLYNTNSPVELVAEYSVNRGRILDISGATGFRTAKAVASVPGLQSTNLISALLETESYLNLKLDFNLFPIDGGDILEIDEEKILVVKSVIDPSAPLYGPVIRGFDGTTPAPHAAGAIVTKLNSNTNSISSINVEDGGFGYIYPPRVTINGGNGSGAKAYAVLQSNSVSEIVIENAGSDYTSSPIITIDPPEFEVGSVVKQFRTGATGIWITGKIEEWDRDSKLLYVYKDAYPLEDFISGNLDYSGINIKVVNNDLLYNTKGKQISVVPESEISVIKD